MIGGCYVTAKRNLVLNSFRDYNLNHMVPFSENNSIISPDDTTLFCSSGMQHFKRKFSNIYYKDTFSNCQKCLRLNDLEEIGDNTHYLVFSMLGLFSFQEWGVEKTINYLLNWLKTLDLKPDYVTIHPERKEWRNFYPGIEVKIDNNCVWSDGVIGGYCTEFYINDIEIGNIVNTLDRSIDVGFGLERISNIKYKSEKPSKGEILKETILVMIDSGIKPGHYKEGHLLKKLLNQLLFTEVILDHQYYHQVLNNKINQYLEYQRLMQFDNNRKKGKQWWYDSYGIDIDNLDQYEQLLKKKK